MPRDRVILIERDEVFRQLLEESLAEHSLAVHRIDDPDQLRNDASLADAAVLVLIGVDLPDKEGFQRFTQVKRIAPRVPVVLATSTLSAEELSLHAKLRQHADLYLDKRILSSESLVCALAPLLPDWLPPPEADLLPSPSGKGTEADAQTQWLMRQVTGEALDSVDEALSDDVDDESGELTPARFARLSAQVVRLRLELEQAQRAARSSPFSDDYRQIQDEARQQEAELAHLRLEVGHREGRIADLERRLESAERERTGAHEELKEAISACEGLTRRCEERETHALELERSLQRLVERHASEREELTRQRGDVEQRLEEARERHRVETESLKERISQIGTAKDVEREELRANYARDLESLESAWGDERQELERQAEARQQELLDRMRVDHEGHVADLQREQRDALDTLRDEHERECESIRRAHDVALAEARREAEAARTSAVEGTRDELQSRIAKLEQSHAKQMEKLRAAHANSIGELAEAHDHDLRARELELTALREEVQRSRAEEARVHQQELDALRQQCRSEVEMLKADTERIVAQSRHGAAEELQASLTQARSEAKVQLAELRAEHAAAIEALQRDHAGRVADLESRLHDERAHTERIAAEDREEALGAERQSFESRLVEMRGTHERAMEALTKISEVRIEALREEHAGAIALEARNAEATQARLQAEIGELRSKYEALETLAEAMRSDAEQNEAELAKYSADLLARDAALEEQHEQLTAAHETFVSLRALLGDLEQSIETRVANDSTPAGVASLLRSIVEILARTPQGSWRDGH